MVFNDIYESGFLPILQSLDLNGTFVWANGGGWFPLCNVKSALFELNFQTLSDWHKIRGPLASLLFLNLYNLYPSHMNLHLPGMAVLIGFLCSSIPQATAEFIGLGSLCIHGYHVVHRIQLFYFESPPLPCWSVLLPTNLLYPLHAFLKDVTDYTNLPSPLPPPPPPLPHHLLPTWKVKQRYGNKNITYTLQPSWKYRVRLVISNVSLLAMTWDKLYSF